MKKKTEKITALQFLVGFITNRINYFTIVASGLILVAVYFSSFKVVDYEVFPNSRNFQINFYNDSIDGGNSKMLRAQVTDSAIAATFVLKEGFVRPYVGITLIPEKMRPFDVSSYNQLELEIAGQNSGNMVVYLISQSANKKIEGRFPDCYLGSNVSIPQQKDWISIAFDEMKVPDWWFDVNNFSPTEKIEPDWHHMLQINVSTGLTPAVEVQRQLKISAIRFSRNNSGVIATMGLIELLIVGGLMILHCVKLRKRSRSEVLTIAYKPVEVKETLKPSDNFLDYIHTHFNDSELSLEAVSTSCNVSQRRIASTILEKYGCNFKSYINQIRINEAKRLMRETDLNISEIAYKVGFNSPNHFNRVFKALTGNNPSGFLNQID
jgi:AraC-like DNA-binding protein